MRIKHKINLHVYDDTDGKNKLFAPDDTLAEVVLDGFTKYTAGRFSVTGGANENLALGDITSIRGFWIQADNDFNLTINGAASPLQMRLGKTGGVAKGSLECIVTSLNVAAPTAGVTVSGIYCVYGDPSA